MPDHPSPVAIESASAAYWNAVHPGAPWSELHDVEKEAVRVGMRAAFAAKDPVNPLDLLTGPVTPPDLRRRVGEWKDYTDKGTHAMIPALMKYVRRGEGEHEVTVFDRMLGLERVIVGWFRHTVGGDDIDPYLLDDFGDDRTNPHIGVEVTVKGVTEFLMFDIDFAGYGD